MKNKFKIVLIALFIFVLTTGIIGCGEVAKGDLKSMVTTDEALEIINSNKGNNDFVLIDVRTPDEFREMHIKGAINRPLADKNTFLKSVENISKNKRILVYCRTQNRSRQAYNHLISGGYEKVQYMQGGITSWSNEGKPLA